MPRYIPLRRCLPLLLAALLVALPACVQVYLRPPLKPLKENVVSGSGQAKVVVISISGPLLFKAASSGGGLFSSREVLTSRVAEELARAREDAKVKALIIKIDSPGGSVSAADLLHNQIMRFKKKKKVPVIAMLMGVAASGGYYLALAADRILALPTCLTGSIGVVAVKLDASVLMGRLGLKADTVKSGPYKDMWSPFRPVSSKERALMSGLIGQYFARFVALVKAGRKDITPAALKQATGGQVMSAATAAKLGLIDQIAYPEDAFKLAKKMAGVKEARLVLYHRPRAYRPNIYAAMPGSPVLSRQDLLMMALTPQPMYLWLPGLQ